MGELIILGVSAVFCFLGVYRLHKGKDLLANGKTAIAIVYKNNVRRSGSDNDSYYHPVVRFLTDKQQWITQELSTGVNPAIEEGTKLEVIYDPENPTDVEINSNFQLSIAPWIGIVVGTCGVVFVALELFGITDLIND